MKQNKKQSEQIPFREGFAIKMVPMVTDDGKEIYASDFEEKEAKINKALGELYKETYGAGYLCNVKGIEWQKADTLSGGCAVISYELKNDPGFRPPYV